MKEPYSIALDPVIAKLANYFALKQFESRSSLIEKLLKENFNHQCILHPAYKKAAMRIVQKHNKKGGK